MNSLFVPSAQPRCSVLPLKPSVRGSRCGFSLIEVILATALLMGSAVVLAQLAGMGREQSQRAAIQSQAQRLCEQTLNEILLGLRPLETTEWQPLQSAVTLNGTATESDDLTLADDLGAEDNSLETPPTRETLTDTAGNPLWLHSVRILPLSDQPGLSALTVAVGRLENAVAVTGAATAETATNEPPARHRQFTLTRWIPTPPDLAPPEAQDQGDFP